MQEEEGDRRRSALQLVAAYGRQIARALIRRHPLRASEARRSFRPWWRTTRIHQEHDPIKDRQPWLTYAALRHLDNHVRPGCRVFEYGVGGSTLYFLDQEATLVSVEHNPVWGRDVTRLASGDWELHIVPPEDDDDIHYRSERAPGSWRKYATIVDRYRTFDVIMVDGRARSACLRHAKNHLAPGGLLVLDNSERPVYREAAREIDRLGWDRTDFYGPGPYNLFFWQTTIWQAPAICPGN